jgi:GNAT superfamily N-acetyltransferase
VTAKVIIRKVDVSDVLVRQAIAELIKECFSAVETEWAGRLHHTTGDWWIATCRGKEVGMAGMVPSYQVRNAGYLHCSGVIPAFRGHGIQRRLIQKRIACARRYGWRQLFTETINSNAASANSLIRCGFRQFNPARTWGSPYAVYWKKDITL